MNTRVVQAAAQFAAGVFVLTGCAPVESGADAPATALPTVELTVFAAASLGGAFDELAARFEHGHPQTDVRPITYDGSSTLATQLIEGARADVFASADIATMSTVVEAGLISEWQPFTSNVMQIAVAPGNPKGISGLRSLTAPELLVVTCAEPVPCGAVSQQLLRAAGVAITPVSEEQTVSAVLTKVKRGEADAGLVYETDVAAAAGAVEGVVIDGAEEFRTHYSIAQLTSAPDPAAATAFIEFVLSPEGQGVLAHYGFGGS